MAETPRDHFKTLGLARDASDDEVRAAYRKLAMETHPDRPGGSADRFITIKEAYETLSDPVKRASHEKYLDVHGASDRDRLDRQLRARAARESAPKTRRAESRPAPDRTSELAGLMARGKYLEAEALARRIAQERPKEPVAWAVLGDIAKMRGRWDEAAKHYAYAAQYDPNGAVYQRKHEEMLDAMTQTVVAETASPARSKVAVGVAMTAVSLMAGYVGFSREAAFLAGWSVGLTFMLFAAGIATGAALAAAGWLERFPTGGAFSGLSPAFALAMIATLQFWLAVGVYVLVGVTQDAFDPSRSRLVAAVVATLLVFALAALANPTLSWMATIVWGGNLALPGAVAGWYVADTFRRAI